MKQTSDNFCAAADEAVSQAARVQQRNLLGAALPAARSAAVTQFEHFEILRGQMKQVREHTRKNLYHYLRQFEQEAVRNGNKLHFADTPEELNSIVHGICQQHHARRVVKGKSMVTEETGLNDYLLRAGLEVTETDLGEYIIQQAGETPSHIVGPALHKSVADISALFQSKHPLGPRQLDTPAQIVAEAREILREKFLAAEVGVIGANALIAENGYSMLVTNEGNGDLCANLPRVLIICTTMERILPRASDAMALQRLLVRSATGQAQSCYTSFYSGPRRQGDTDGPLETHIVLLDNKRSDILASDYREMLDCIRCGACLNHCPIYIGVGGHTYGWVYPGPMGSVLTPLLTSLEQSHWLPNACTTCGRCAEVCPAEIPLPDLLRDLRHDEVEQRLSSSRWRGGIKAHAWLLQQPRLYHWLSGIGIRMLYLLGHRRGAYRSLPGVGRAWTGQRDFPAPQRATFMQQYKSARRRSAKSSAPRAGGGREQNRRD